RTLVGHIANRQARNKVKLYNENRPIFERFHVERQIENAFRRRVWLANGGYIVIDETEALVAIDINTGRHKGGKDQGTTALEVNLEAADEIARQLRLRNIGGLIVIDFIDMRSRKDQHTVVRRLRDAVKRDRAKVRIFPMSSLGLVEMTRQRVEESIRSAIFQDCPYCEGRGFVKSTLSMSVEIQRKLAEVLRRHFEGFKPSTDDANLQTTEPPEPHLRIFVHPEVLERLRDEDEELLLDLERKFGGRLSFRGDDSYRSEEFRIVDVSTGDELH
ncbi:MAG: ribonuclease E/G, partial [Verrucomicrobiota bacterium]|nr:ribonuclease E/G [Verrucomicrobiota bacterium]